MAEKVNIAQIGCGYWGPNILRNLKECADCNLAAVVDSSKERLEYVKEKYPGVLVTSSLSDVFADESIDAVVIATPVATHFPLALKALKAGKHILVEKPMATRVSEIKRIGALSRKNKLVAMAGHTFLYNPAVRYLKKLIDSNELGKVRYIYSQRLNLGRIRTDVDVLWNFAPHDVSIVQYLLGGLKPVKVIRHGMDYIQPGIDDVVFLNLVYPGKIAVNIHVSWLDPCKVRRMVVVGSKKMAVYDDVSRDKIVIYDKGIDIKAVLGDNMDFDGFNKFHLCHRDGEAFVPKIDFEEPLKIEIAHFIDCIKNGVVCLTGPDHALEVVKILTKADKK